jgi:sortase A
MKKSKHYTLCLLALAFLLSLGITVYPLVSNYLSQRNKSQVLTAYAQAVEATADDTLSQILSAAQAYNAALDAGTFSQEALLSAAQNYYDRLNVGADGIMGYVEIPKISVYLPIYHGTEAETLDVGIGHLLGSSLPVGGMGTHTVLTGHSGMAREKMFSDLDQLKTGDVFYLHVLGQTLAYEVDQIKIVLPENTDYLGTEPEADYCTLVTCTPFGVNTHRLLVRGHRVAYEEDTETEQTTTTETAASTWTQQYIKGVIAGLGIVAGVTVVAIVAPGFRKRGLHEKR